MKGNMSGSTMKIEVITIGSDEDSLSDHDIERENDNLMNCNLLSKENEYLNLSPKHIIDDDKVIAHLMEMFPDVHVNDVVTLLESFKDDQSTEENLIYSIGNRLIDASRSETQDKCRPFRRKRKNGIVNQWEEEWQPKEVVNDLSTITCFGVKTSNPLFYSSETPTVTKTGFKRFIRGQKLENNQMEGQEIFNKPCNVSASKEEIMCANKDEHQNKASGSYELTSVLLKEQQIQNCATNSDKISVSSSVSDILPCVSEAKRSTLSFEHTLKFKSHLAKQSVTQPLAHCITTSSLAGTLSAKACNFSKGFEPCITSTGCLTSPSYLTAPRKYKEIRPKVLITDPLKKIFVNNSTTLVSQPTASSCVFTFESDSSKTTLANQVNSNIMSSQVATNQAAVQSNVLNPKPGFIFPTSSKNVLSNQINSNAITPQMLSHQTVVQPNVLNTKLVQANQTLSLLFSQSAQNSSTVMCHPQLIANQNVDINHSYPQVTLRTEPTSLVPSTVNSFQMLPDQVATNSPKNIVISNVYEGPLLLVPTSLKSVDYGSNSAVISLINSDVLPIKDANPKIISTTQEETNRENVPTNKSTLLNGNIVSLSPINQPLQSPKNKTNAMPVDQKETNSDSILNSEDKIPVKLVIDKVISLSSTFNEQSCVQMQENQETLSEKNYFFHESPNKFENFDISLFDKHTKNSDDPLCSKLSPAKPEIETVSNCKSGKILQSNMLTDSKVATPLKAAIDSPDLSENSQQVIKKELRNSSISNQELSINNGHMLVNSKKLNAKLSSLELSSKVKPIMPGFGLMKGTSQLPKELMKAKYICMKCDSTAKFEDLAQCTAGHLFCYSCLVKFLGYDRIGKVIHCLLDGCQAEVLDHSDAIITSGNKCNEVFEDTKKDSVKVNIEISASSKYKSSEIIKQVTGDNLELPGPSGLCKNKEPTYPVAVQQEEQKYECQCCFNYVDFDSLVQCYEAHLFCCECLRKYTEESVFGQGKAFLTCMANGCDVTFPLSQLKRALPDDLIQKYEDRVTEESLNLAKLQNFYRCPFCKFGAEMIEEGQIFMCQNPQCEKKTCRLCKVDWNDHKGLSCEEVEKKDETKIRVVFEEKMAMTKIRECPSCKTKFTKESGCNKITCRCGKSMCYICREPITAYTHFCHHSRDPNHTCTKCKLCPLTSNDKEDDKRAIAEIKAKAQLAREEQGFSLKKEIGAPDIHDSNHNVKYPLHYFHMNRCFRRRHQRQPDFYINCEAQPTIGNLEATYAALQRRLDRQRAVELQQNSAHEQNQVPEKQSKTFVATPRQLQPSHVQLLPRPIFMQPQTAKTQQQMPPVAHIQVQDSAVVRDISVNLGSHPASHKKVKSVYTNEENQKKATSQKLNISSITPKWFQTLTPVFDPLKVPTVTVDMPKSLDLVVGESTIFSSQQRHFAHNTNIQHESRNTRKEIQLMQSAGNLLQNQKLQMHFKPQFSQSCSQKTVVEKQTNLNEKDESNKIKIYIKTKQFDICNSLKHYAANIIHMLENSAAEASDNISSNVSSNKEFQATQKQAIHTIKIVQVSAQSKITLAVESAVNQIKDLCEKIKNENIPNLTETQYNQLAKARIDAYDIICNAGKIARSEFKDALRDVVNIFMKSKFHLEQTD